jgi:RNA polymerase sigma-70 factor (ECF subfamily)
MSDTAKASVFELLLPAAVDSRTSPGESAIETAVTELFEQSRHGMLRYLTSLGLPLHDGEEIVQETFLLLFQLLQQQNSHQNIRGWLFRVAHNLALKRRAANQTHTERHGATDLGEAHHDPAPSPEEQLLFRQRRRQLLAIVEVLPEQDRYCLYLRAEGLRYREIAEILDISLGSVSKSLTRAIQRLSNVEYRWRDAL